jgi:hypothetical protein
MAEIKPHFLKSIREIDSDIVDLQNSILPIQNDINRLLETRAAIVDLYGADTEIPPAPGSPLTPALSPKGAREKVAGPEAGAPKKRQYKRRAQVEKPAEGGGSAVAAPAAGDDGHTNSEPEKPDTVAGAMKFCIRKLKSFTEAELVAELQADADFAKLLKGASASAVRGNLAYWTNKGKLSKDGDKYRNHEF